MVFCKSRSKIRRLRPMLSRPRTALFTLVLVAWASVFPAMLSAEDFGDQSLGWTREQERAVAGYLKRRLQAQGDVLNDVWVEYWLAERAERLRQSSTAPLGSLSILLINDRNFNAFALPGNVMGFNLGLWQTARTEAEFVSVLAHELAHLNLRHFNRLADSNRQQTWLALSGALLGIALIGVDPELGGAAFTSSQATALQQRLAFSRAMETEADRFASQLLREVGYDPSAGAAVFQRLQQQITFQPGLSDFWQTHPLPANRVARLGQQEAPSGDAPEHHYDALRWYVNQRFMPDDSFAKAPKAYDNLSLPAETGGDNTLPPSLLAETDPNLTFGWIIRQNNQRSPAKQQERLLALTRLFPDFDPAWFELARLSEAQMSNNVEACKTALSYLGRIQATYLQALEMKRSLSAQCEPDREAEATAQWLWHKGEENRAMNLLRRAIETPKSASQVARLRQLLTHFEEQLALLPR